MDTHKHSTSAISEASVSEPAHAGTIIRGALAAIPKDPALSKFACICVVADATNYESVTCIIGKKEHVYCYHK